MDILKKADRWAAIRLQSVGRKQLRSQERPLIFLGGMSRTGSHLLHSLLDGHSRIKAIPEEDFFLRTNVISLLKQAKLFFSNGDDKLRMFKEQNRNNLWLDVARKSTDERIGPHKVSFPTIDYDKFESLLKELAFKKIYDLAELYQGYINCILGAIPVDGAEARGRYSWDLYFSGNADFLIRSFMAWNKENKVIIPIRHPLQRFASHKKWQNSQFFCTEDVVSSWAKVHETYSFFLDRYKGRIMLVDYTELVVDVSGVMSAVADFLGLEYEDILTRPTLLGKPIAGNSSFVEASGSAGAIYKDSLERYKNILTDVEISIINDRLVPVYEALTRKSKAGCLQDKV